MRQHPPRRTPALAARFAAEFNSGMSDGLAARFANFRRICEQAGRDPAEVRLSTTLPVCCGETRGEAARRAAALGEAGADTVYFHLYDVRDLDHVRLLGRNPSAGCATTAVLDFGKLIASGPTATVLREDAVIRAYLGVGQ